MRAPRKQAPARKGSRRMAPIRLAALSRQLRSAQARPRLSRICSQRIAHPIAFSFPAALAQQPALSAAKPDLGVLGRQYRARELCRRSCAADDAVLRAVDRRVSDIVAVRAAASEA